MTTDEFMAIEQIRATITRYAWSVDAADYVAMARCFTVGGKLQVTSEMTLHGRQDISDTLGGRALARGHGNSGTRFQRHNVSNIQIELDGDRAAARCYFTVFTEIGLDHLGRYEDRFVKHGTEWLMEDRVCRLDAVSARSRFAPALMGEAPFIQETGEAQAPP
ncbi:nuclear transport factor 2 family protein [Novosphingobium sp. G106]|uniref:nuclear transport factor 2 family protein n=1 Tax=Novosphingobium sp. G106 TaxID=2849500 RepID=UPI001C2CD742|nr:nuclear transport factor 2 family protein [Novosphingobium sp. G106]MBV1688875.1 nuclear transport factor 2 family protein [Novosphingobium sp. G106]